MRRSSHATVHAPEPQQPPTLSFDSAEAFDAWIDAHADDEGGLWLKVAKKASGIASVTHAEAVLVALCHGWIDGQRRGLDDTWFLQRFTPRRARSKWSQVNRDHVARLTAEGRMRPRGLAEVERAKADGRWDAAYPSQRNAQPPPDLEAALAADPVLRAAFEARSGSERFTIIFRLLDAKRPETRDARLKKFVAALRGGEPIR